MAGVDVRLGSRAYRVTITRGDVDGLAEAVWKRSATGRVFVCFDANVFALYGASVIGAFRRERLQVVDIVIPSGERYKSLATARRLYDILLAHGISRDDLVVAIGGGVTTDLVGYVAATILRGVAWVAVPSTLLGMVDAAIGGKTGVNHASGKNLIGVFWQPVLVWCDTDMLGTLPERHLTAGLGEVAKYAGLAGEPMLGRLERFIARGDRRHGGDLRWLIHQSVAYKAAVVAADERDTGGRMVLNLGHTFAHAIETALGYGRLLHGEAVLLGLYAAVRLSALHAGRTDSDCRRYEALLNEMLKWVPRRRLDIDAIIAAMRLDKKRTGRRLRFVLLRTPGRPIIADTVSTPRVRKALAQMFMAYRQERR